MQKSIHISTVISLFCIIMGCASFFSARTVKTPEYWPTKGWKTSTPEKQGMDSDIFAEALDRIRERHGENAIRFGRVL